MRIGFDARKLHDFGIGQYIENLLSYLLKLDEENTYYIFLSPQDAPHFNLKGKRWVKVEERAGKYSLTEHVSLSLKARRLGLDLFHSPHYVVPLFMPCKVVVTVHDLIHLILPRRPWVYAYARAMMALSCKKASAIITGSFNTKRDLIHILGIEGSKVEVTPYGVNPIFKPPEGNSQAMEGFLRERGLPREGYILYVGARKPHKNLMTLLEAFALLQRRLNGALVISGPEPNSWDPFHRAIRNKGLQGRVFFSGHLTNEQLNLLYGGAQLFVFPSLYEGFGLPPLEAMACGVPVVAASSSCIPEILGDAALLIDPQAIDKWAEAMYNGLQDDSLRLSLRQKGLKRVMAFSWEATALKTLKLYHEVVSRGAP